MKIENLILQTNHLTEMVEFYTSVLELKQIGSLTASVVLQAGYTRLQFCQAQTGINPLYHFAFNIPPNLYAQAKVWLEERFDLVKGKQGQVEFDFSNWDAHGLYFYDPVGNILEFIARDMLPPAKEKFFTSSHILSVSEVGIVVEDVLTTITQIEQVTGLQPYREQTDTFTAMGDEHGLLIVVEKLREWYPNTGLKAETMDLEAIITFNGTRYLLANSSAGLLAEAIQK